MFDQVCIQPVADHHCVPHHEDVAFDPDTVQQMAVHRHEVATVPGIEGVDNLRRVFRLVEMCKPHGFEAADEHAAVGAKRREMAPYPVGYVVAVHAAIDKDVHTTIAQRYAGIVDVPMREAGAAALLSVRRRRSSGSPFRR